MARSFVVLVALAFVLVALDSSFADPKANIFSDSKTNSTSSSAEKIVASELVLNNTDTKKVKKDRFRLTGTAEDIKNHMNKIDDQSGLKGTDGLQKEASSTVSELEEGNKKKRSSNKGLEREEESEKKKGADEAGSIPLTPSRKEGFHGEECDPSNMCTDEEDQFVACLRVPGNDSPHLSLLIQNKGKDTLFVTISAPRFVRLEKSMVQLQKKGDKKVKVTIRGGGSNNSIILAAGKGRCSLDLKDLISQNTVNDLITSSNSSFKAFRSPTLVIISFFFALVLVVFAAFRFIQLYQRKSKANKYQRLDMELRVSDGTKPEKEINDGWNDDWGDDWEKDDEEAPKTPSIPATPSVSCRGLASRRLSKEGWKD